MRTYNPLSVDELGRNAARALIEYAADVLPLVRALTVLVSTLCTT